MIWGAEAFPLPNDADRHEVLVETNEIEEFLTAFRHGATADFIQPKLHGEWGVLWTIPPCDPTAATGAGKQMVRMGAEEIRWIRRARLRNAGRVLEVMIVTELPNMKQMVLDIATRQPLPQTSVLSDAITDALNRAIQSSAA